jgi:acetyl-CoA carboxylase biotin carboxyl carrier protein
MKRQPSQLRKGGKSAPASQPNAFVNPKVLQELIDVFQSTGVTDLEVERQGLRVRLRREGTNAVTHTKDVSVQIREPAEITETVPSLSSGGLLTVTSPIVGIFYRSASPDTDAYVEEGSYVRKGQVLCVVEAMKLMNEIESEVDGRVVKILQENAKPVEYGEPLFLMEPGDRPEA